jgi:hypothetical protein
MSVSNFFGESPQLPVTLTVPAINAGASTFTGPVTFDAAITVDGLATLSDGATISGLVTCNTPILITGSNPGIVLNVGGSLGPQFNLVATSAPLASRNCTLYDAGANSIVMLGIQPSTIVSTTASLTSALSGYNILVQSAGAYTISLPAPVTGLKFILRVGAALSGAVTIAATSAIVYGSVLSSDGTAVTGGAITAAKTNVILGTTASIGDIYEFYSTSALWHVQGVTAVHGSVTFS